VKFDKSISFQWDLGNIDKNWEKHQISNIECEEVFFDDQKITLKDVLHSGKEDRYIIFGKTKNKKLLFIAYTIRNNKIRIISARVADKKEKKFYEKSN
jgi:uncharacterized DUF497 family protein